MQAWSGCVRGGTARRLLDDICGQAVLTTFETPRMIAGDALTIDSDKCRLTPMPRNDEYGAARDERRGVEEAAGGVPERASLPKWWRRRRQ